MPGRCAGSSPTSRGSFHPGCRRVSWAAAGRRYRSGVGAAPEPIPIEGIQRDPFGLFERWLGDARSAVGPDRADAMTLATATSDGEPSARMVMLRGFNRRGFVF